jgi:hypothetical protein
MAVGAPKAPKLNAKPRVVPQQGTVTLELQATLIAKSGPSLAVWTAENLGDFDPIGSELVLDVSAGGVRHALSVIPAPDASGAIDVKIRWRPGVIPPQSVTIVVSVFEHPNLPLILAELEAGTLPLSEASSRMLEASRAVPPDISQSIAVEVTEVVPVAPTVVTLRRSENDPSADQSLWSVIRLTTEALSFDHYSDFIDAVFCVDAPTPDLRSRAAVRDLAARRSLPFPDTDPYRLLKVATEVFMQLNCGVFFDQHQLRAADTQQFRNEEQLRLYRAIMFGEVERSLRDYLGPNRILPYLDIVRNNLPDWGLTTLHGKDANDGMVWACQEILREKLTRPCLVELMWSYWLEEGMLVQTSKALALRFQNRFSGDGHDPLALLEIDPLRPLNNFLWGYIQDEEHRLSVPRRAYEYDHQYGMTLVGKAIPTIRGADTRVRFLEAFHNLLYLCAIFFKEEDDTTVVADAFPILNGLREVHLLLTQGAHNQYRDLPWTARQEMLMEEWILSRPEFREFLPRRIMVDYPEQWMHSVEAMKNLQGWRQADVLHFRDLSQAGERILLSIRFGEWTAELFPERAKNWARYFRAEIQRYTHAYRAVTGADLTDHPDATMPGVLLRERLASGRSTRTGAVRRQVMPAPEPAAMPSRPAARRLPTPASRPVNAELPAWNEARD